MGLCDLIEVQRQALRSQRVGVAAVRTRVGNLLSLILRRVKLQLCEC